MSSKNQRRRGLLVETRDAGQCSVSGDNGQEYEYVRNRINAERPYVQPLNCAKSIRQQIK